MNGNEKDHTKINRSADARNTSGGIAMVRAWLHESEAGGGHLGRRCRHNSNHNDRAVAAHNRQGMNILVPSIPRILRISPGFREHLLGVPVYAARTLLNIQFDARSE